MPDYEWFDDPVRPLDDREYPDEADSSVDDWADDSPSETIRCEQCGAEIYEDAESCPICGHYQLGQSGPFADRPIWWTALGALGIAALFFALLFVWIAG